MDLVTGVLAGTQFGPNVADLFVAGDRSQIGQCFAAIDIEAVADRGELESRLEAYIDQLAATPTAHLAPGPVLYPGQACVPPAGRAGWPDSTIVAGVLWTAVIAGIEPSRPAR